MTDQEYVERLLELSAEFSKLVTADERLASQIPLGAAVVFQVSGQTGFNRRAMATAKERHAHDPSLPIMMVHVDGLAPPASRLINPHLESVSL